MNECWHQSGEQDGRCLGCGHLMSEIEATKAEQALALRDEPVAWLYTMRAEKKILAQECVVGRFNPDLRPFGRKGIDHDPSYEVEEVPLYAAPISGERKNQEALNLLHRVNKEGMSGGLVVAIANFLTSLHYENDAAMSEDRNALAAVSGERVEPRYWLIHFDDRDRPLEVFTERNAALRRYDQISGSWNATLFESIHDNSQPGSHATRPKPAVSGERVREAENDRCARVCESWMEAMEGDTSVRGISMYEAARRCAAQIRALPLAAQPTGEKNDSDD